MQKQSIIFLFCYNQNTPLERTCMDYLWSPWRMNYINNKAEKPQCVFCHAIEQNRDDEYLILYRGKKAFIILNRFPYTSGHLMVLPYDHQPSYEDLDAETRA